MKLRSPLVMGIVNTSPDSFFGGNLCARTDSAVAHALRLIAEGADIIDVGGESTKPGAIPTQASDELKRLLPVIESLRGIDVPLSVDTYKPEVMKKVLDMGVSMINNIFGFREPCSIDVVAKYSCGLCVMHMQGRPNTMQQKPHYSDLISEVKDKLSTYTRSLESATIDPRRIVIDPGFGFGKTLSQNFLLLNRLKDLKALGYPLLVGTSRKSMLGIATGREVKDRLPGSIASALACVIRGASILRVHDVAATRDALKIWDAAEKGKL